MEEKPAAKPGMRWEMAVPVALFVVALAIRLIGIGWGLQNDLHDHSYHPDEVDIFLYSQSIEPSKGDFTPGFYNYGTLYLTVLRVTSDMVATYTGGFDPEKPETFLGFMTRAHMAGRILNALAGAGIAWIVFLILRRRTSLLGSVMGGLAIAVAPALVVHSRFQTVDMAAAFFVALSLHYTLKLLPAEGEEPHTDTLKIVLLAGLYAGLAAGTKYTGGLVLLSLVAALALLRPKTLARDLVVGVAASAVAFFLSTPGVLADSARFAKDFSYEMQHTATGHGMIFANTSIGFIYHLGNLFVGMGTILTILGLGGLTLGALRKQAWVLVVLAFFLPYYLLIGRAEVKFLRYTFPLTIGVACGFGWLMGKAHQRRGWGTGLVALGIGGLGGLDLGGLMGTARFSDYMLREDPRDQAARYLKGLPNAPDLLVAYASDPWYYSVPLFRESAAPRRMSLLARTKRMELAASPRVAFHVEDALDPFAFDVRLFDVLNPDYIAFSSFESGDPWRLRNAKGLGPTEQVQVDRYQTFLTRLRKDYELDKVFGLPGATVHDLEYVQPQVYLWRKK